MITQAARRKLSYLLALTWAIGTHVLAALPNELSGLDVVQQKAQLLVFSKAAKATAVLFLSAKCPCSMAHEPRLRALQSEFEPQGISFVAIHSNADEDMVMTRTHFEAAHLPFPVLQDVDSKWANEFGALKTPHAFVVGRDGKIIYQGGVDDSSDPSHAKTEFLKLALRSAIQNQAPNPAQTRALGCMIRRN